MLRILKYLLFKYIIKLPHGIFTWKFNLSYQSGARVTIHSADHKPFVDEYGMDIMANQLTQISLQEVCKLTQNIIFNSLIFT